MKYSILNLDGKLVGKGHPCYVIGEIGSNHNKDFNEAKQLIDVAKKSGCDAVKFQSYTADGLYSIYTPRTTEMEGRTLAGEGPHDLIKRIQMPLEWHRPLKKYCQKVGITFCSTPFDESMVTLLESINIPFYKVASFEITHYPMLEMIARTRKPVVLATGNSGLADIELAVAHLRKHGCQQLALLHCVSQYPSREEDMNLLCIKTIAQAFDCVVGLSDHTTSNLAAALSVALGASIVEKHITLDKNAFGPDHLFALNPQELQELVATIRRTEMILGSSVKVVLPNEMENHRVGRRSIVANCDMKAGDVVTAEKIVIKRPGLGLHPKYLPLIEGKRLIKGVCKDQWLKWDNFMEGLDRD